MTQSTALAQAKAGGLAVFTQANNPFIGAAAKAGASEGLWLRLNGKTGTWVSNYPDTPEFEPGTELVFDLYHAEAFWMGFDANNKPYRGPKAAIVTGAALPEPPTPGLGQIPATVKWNKQVLVKVAMPDTGKLILLSASAKWGASAIWKLLKKYGELMGGFPDPGSKTGYMTPIVRIGVNEVNKKITKEGVITDPVTGAKTIGQVEENAQFFSETYEITGWISQKEMEEILESQGGADVENVGGASDAELPASGAAASAAIASSGDAAARAQGVVEVIPPPAQGGFRRRVGTRT